MKFLQFAQTISVLILLLNTLQATPTYDGDLNGRGDASLSLRHIADRLDNLETRDKNHDNLIVELKKELSDYKEKVRVLQAELSENTGFISTLLSNITRCQEKVGSNVGRSRRDIGMLNVAFTAGLTRSILHAPAYHNIVFDHVETNIGNGYDSLTGIFTAPVSGTYVFYTSILVYNGREVFCRIVVNGVNMANTYGRGTDNRLDQGSQAVVVQLQKGHTVAVQNKVDDDAIFGNQDVYTTFSGFLLHSSTFSG